MLAGLIAPTGIQLDNLSVGAGQASGSLVAALNAVDIDAHERAPIADIVLSNATMSEGLPAWTVVGRLSAISSDPDAAYQWSFVDGEGAGDNSQFALNGDALIARQRLDYEKQSTYSIRVQAYDGVSRLEKVIAIGVTDVVETPLRQTGQWGGAVATVAVSGAVGCIGRGQTLVVLDLRTPGGARAMGEVALEGSIRKVAMAGQYAYVLAEGAGLQVVSISNPARPAVAATYGDGSTSMRDVWIAGSYAYVAVGSDLVILDISDPQHPSQAGQYSDQTEIISAVTVAGDYAYLGTIGGWLRVVNVADPANPSLAGTCISDGSTSRITVAGGYAYLAQRERGVRIIDVREAAVPRLAGSWWTSSSAVDVLVAGSRMYAVDAMAGTTIVDISDPAVPVAAGEVGTGLYVSGAAASDGRLYVATERSGLLVWDISQPAAPVLAGAYADAGTISKVRVAGNYAYCISEGERLQIIDIRSPGTTTLIGSLINSSYVRGMDVAGRYVYLGEGQTLRIIDVANPGMPREVARLEMSDWVADIQVVGEYAYVLRNGALAVVDVKDASAPRVVGSLFDAGGSTLDVDGRYAYIGNHLGVRVVDISDATAPQLVTTWHTLKANWTSLAVSGSYAYGTTPTSGEFVVVDISNPAAPSPVSTFGVVERAHAVVVRGTTAYVSGTNGVYLLDVSNPASLRVIGEYRTAGAGYRLDVVGDRVYVADGGNGLVVLETGAAEVPEAVGKFGAAGGKARPWTIDDGGDRVTFQFTGGGTGELMDDGTLVLTGTTGRSVLTITVRRGGMGDGQFVLNGISCAGPLKSIQAKAVAMRGDIEIGRETASGPGAVSIQVGQVLGGSVRVPALRSLTAMQWLGSEAGAGVLETASVGTIRITGRKDDRTTDVSEYLVGDLQADVRTGAVGAISVRGKISGLFTATGGIGSISAGGIGGYVLAGVGRANRSLGSITVAGDMEGLDLRADGSIGSVVVKGDVVESRIQARSGIRRVVVGSLLGSEVLVGVDRSFGGDVVTPGEFSDDTARIGTLSVAGWKASKGQSHGVYVMDSDVWAPNVGSVVLANVAEGSGAVVHVLEDAGTMRVSLKTPVDGMVEMPGTWRNAGDRPGLWEVI